MKLKQNGEDTKNLKNIQTMIATIRSFSFLIKQKSLFYELMDEIKENEHLSAEELIFHIIKMFGGTNIKIPSANEFRLYQYLLNNAKDYYEILSKDYNNPWRVVEKRIKIRYKESLHDVELQPIVVGFVDTLLELNYDKYRDKFKSKNALSSKRSYIKKMKNKGLTTEYNYNDDMPLD